MVETRLLLKSTLSQLYYNQFKRHVHQVRAGLLAEEQALRPSFIAPSACWTPEEKELFFRALTTHSRLRPDLIAASIKTKNEVEVCVYLDLLEQEKDKVEMDDNDDQVVLDGAMEMSEEWTAFEEHQSKLLIIEELNEEAKAQKRCGSRSRHSDNENDDRCDLVTARSYMTAAELDAMESILREEEDSSMKLGVVPDEIRDRFTTEEREGPPSRSPSASARTSANRASPAPSASPSNYGQNDFTTPDPMGMHISKEEDELLEDEDDEDGSSVYLFPAARRRLRKRLYMRRQRALKAGRTVDVTSVKLRPGRRRKPRKPRPSRAPKGGRASSSKSRGSSLASSVYSSSSDEEDSNEKMDEAVPESNSTPSQDSSDDEDYAHPNKGGLTAYTRAKQDLLDSGIDAKILRDEGIGLFHLNVLSKLLKIFTSGYREDDSEDTILTLGGDTQPMVSADVLRLLTGVTIEFLDEVVRRALTISKQHLIFKRNTKVWRALEEDSVSIENIRLAIEMMGMNLLDRHRYFAQLLNPSEDEDGGELMHDDEYDGRGEDEDEDEKEDNGSENNRESAFPTNHALNKELYEPHIYLPPAYRRPQTDEDIVLDDEHELQKELQADEIVDILDMELAKEYEAELWENV